MKEIIKRYIIQNGCVGNSMLFWKKDGVGYTTELDEAERFTITKARKIKRDCKSSHIFTIWHEAYLYSKRTYHVNTQHCSITEAKK